MKKITTAAAALALVAGLAGCGLIPSPPPPPDIAPATPTSMLPPECPIVGRDDVSPVRIPKGTPRETIGSVLNAYNGWLNAGSELVTAWGPGKAVPENCVADLAAKNTEAYAVTLFTTHSDAAWQDYFASIKAMNQQNLATVRIAEPGTGGRGTFELLKEIDSSATDSGTFLKFHAAYRPVLAGQGSWEDLDKPTRWYVELVPAGEFLVINYIETKPAAGYP
jgi:predicted small lipoprotein YifL